MSSMLYDSDTYVVVHESIDVPGEEDREGYQIVDKLTNQSVYLDGPWAEAFRAQIARWQLKTPAQSEVEEVLNSYSELATNPLVIH